MHVMYKGSVLPHRKHCAFFYLFIHLFSVGLLQDMEVVIFIIIQEKNKTAACSIYVCKL
jgi:hypothetical protein